ncbi:glycoside hydrolase family 18 protein [Terrimonas pollutisoli]|uniref:glycoside hydrolase family 18 protein n=1 Tax=Terrimonas pollutisoli TaxID=3034147 RepID=UPI0023ED3902|nr:glycoside hydrolase family 18 protein [Terrimonas sp. H1YJ31]
MKKIVYWLTALMFISLFLFAFIKNSPGDDRNELAVIAYYSGDNTTIDNYPVEKLTHIIYSFCHLKGNRLNVDNKGDSATIRKLVSLKKKNTKLKVLLSLGGWGGCEFCSPVFSTDEGRKAFARSVKEVNDYFKTDGIDLDWEYPAIEGHPGHAFKLEDKANFTALVKDLRNSLGNKHDISFAAGGFPKFLQESIDWKEVMPVVDYVNLMSYDLVNGYSTRTGHHTPLYSTPEQVESADNAITYLTSLGVPANKIVIGAAFYARTWENVDSVNNGLYQPGKFKSFISYRQFDSRLSKDDGFVFYRDTISGAAYAYNMAKKTFATFDDPVSIEAKTKYAIDKGLKGIMFWELTLDKTRGGLLDVIDRSKKK